MSARVDRAWTLDGVVVERYSQRALAWQAWRSGPGGATGSTTDREHDRPGARPTGSTTDR